jgi:hypothetical protein
LSNLPEISNILNQLLFSRFFLPELCHLPASGCQPYREEEKRPTLVLWVQPISAIPGLLGRLLYSERVLRHLRPREFEEWEPSPLRAQTKLFAPFGSERPCIGACPGVGLRSRLSTIKRGYSLLYPFQGVTDRSYSWSVQPFDTGDVAIGSPTHH